MKECPDCKGTGKVPRTILMPKLNPELVYPPRFQYKMVTCPRCKGTGKIDE